MFNSIYVVGIVLSWTMIQVDNMAGIQSYQLFAYQETNTPPNSSLWKKVITLNFKLYFRSLNDMNQP